MLDKEAILRKIRSLGVVDPSNPTSEDLKLVLEAYLKNKTLDVEAFTNYISIVKPTLQVLFDGLTAFSQDEKEVATSTLQIIGNAVQILGAELARDLPSEERSQLRDQIIGLVNEARKESAESRDFRKWIAIVGAGVSLVVFGTIVTVLTQGRSTELLSKGADMIVEAVSLVKRK